MTTPSSTVFAIYREAKEIEIERCVGASNQMSIDSVTRHRVKATASCYARRPHKGLGAKAVIGHHHESRSATDGQDVTWRCGDDVRIEAFPSMVASGRGF